jgi:cell wall assembly regulator SMI1
MDEQRISLRAALNHLEEVWSAGDPAISATLRPGLTNAEIDAASSRLPFRVPDDARVLWRWHNGQGPHSTSQALRGSQLLSVDEAVERYFGNLRAFPNIQEEVPYGYEPGWLPLTEAGPRPAVLIDADTSGIVLHTWMDEDIVRGRLNSLAEVVCLWTSAIEEGAWLFPGEGDVEAIYVDDQVLQRIAITPEIAALLC